MSALAAEPLPDAFTRAGGWHIPPEAAPPISAKYRPVVSATVTASHVPLWFAAGQLPPTAAERETARQIVGQGYTPAQAGRLARLIHANAP